MNGIKREFPKVSNLQPTKNCLQSVKNLHLKISYFDVSLLTNVIIRFWSKILKDVGVKKTWLNVLSFIIIEGLNE